MDGTHVFDKSRKPHVGREVNHGSVLHQVSFQLYQSSVHPSLYRLRPDDDTHAADHKDRRIVLRLTLAQLLGVHSSKNLTLSSSLNMSTDAGFNGAAPPPGEANSIGIPAASSTRAGWAASGRYQPAASPLRSWAAEDRTNRTGLTWVIVWMIAIRVQRKAVGWCSWL